MLLWYAAADVVALSSDREGTPLALIEAASAASLGRLVADADLRLRFGEAAPKRAARYDSARLVDDLDRLYREVLSEGTARR